MLQVASQNLLSTNMTIEGTEPLSDGCKQFPYTRYFRVDNMDSFKYFGQHAEAGDLIELVPGVYNLGDGKVDTSLPFKGNPDDSGEDDGGNNEPPQIADSGTIYGRMGTKTQPIIFCGTAGATIIDGADSEQYAYAGIRIGKSVNIRLSGFKIQNVMKGKKTVATLNLS